MKRDLKFWDVFSLSSGAMISSGLFILPGIIYAKAGPAMILSYILAAIMIIPSMLAKAELSTAMPKAGGTYFFIDRSLGPVMGIFGGFANWFSLSLKSAFALVGIGAFAVLIFPGLSLVQIKMIAVLTCLLFTVFNIFSVKMTGRVQVLLVILLLIILVLFIGRGFVDTQPERYIPFMPNGAWSVFSTAGLVFVSFGGLTKVTSVAEEVSDPGKNIPRGMLLSFTVVTLIYVLTVGVAVGLLDTAELSGSLVPLSLAAEKIAGKPGMFFLSAAAMMAFITTANAGILSASRVPLAMSRDKLIPDFLAALGKKTGTPLLSILMTSAFMISVIILLDLENLVKTASTLMIILFILVNISVIIMRESRIQNYRPTFKMPLYPFLPIFAIVSYGFLLIEMGLIPLAISMMFFMFGLLIYLLYARKRVTRVSALTHIVTRISAKELQDSSLEAELRDIIMERDSIVEDRFDDLVRHCAILDLKKEMSADQVFRKISLEFAQKWNLNSDELYKSFKERELQSATVIKPGLAIPHIIVPGKGLFDIMLIRSNTGMSFSGQQQPVKTMFVLMGSIDQRNYHLRALMAIANIIHDGQFRDRWEKAGNPEELRDVILLSGRERDQVPK